MAELNARGGRRGRRTRNEINMVPFIDVMLVLLIIFMVSAPLLPSGVVDLPSMGKARQAPEKVVEVVLDDDEQVRVRVNRGEWTRLSVHAMAAHVKSVQDEAEGGATAAPVIISARKDIRYESVVQVMDLLQRGGVQRVGLSVRTNGG
ncbi:MAG: biopolymer transporter ExbD [Burkholderiales bacterium]|nr:biopolymer transporter ExbD [Burkholderiales bacterium]